MRIVDLQSADGIAVRYRPYGILLASGDTVPTDGSLGYAPGCLFTDIDASSGAQNWINTGTYSSSAFKILSSTGVDLTSLVATATEINRTCDVSTRLVAATASTLAVTVADHDGKIIELDRAAGIAVTLPSLATSSGAVFRFWVKTTFTGAATIKSVASGDIMVGHALMGNNSDNTVVDWPAVAANTFDTINLFGTANSTGGIEGQEIEIIGGTGRWYVSIRGDAAGTEATPFENTV